MIQTVTAKQLESMDLPPPRQMVAGLITAGLNILAGPPKLGKALALDTRVPTPGGWRTMGDLEPGDLVFGPNGQPTEVVAATDTLLGRPCYRVVFDDGSEVTADANHLWRTVCRDKRGATVVVTTEQIRDTLTARGASGQNRRWNHKVPASLPPDYAEAALPIDPYVLGVWLGDGTSIRAEVTIADRDHVIADELVARGVPLSRRKHGGQSCQAYGLSTGDRSAVSRGGSIQATMRDLGLLGNKHIPEPYFTASRSQRADLLRGIVDTDGHVDRKGRVEITLTDAALAGQVVQLVRSLGHVPRMRESLAKLGGVVIGPRFRIGFKPTGPDPVTTVPFKASRLRPPAARAGARRIVAVEPVESVPVRCIQVARPDGLFLVTESHITTHNSFLSLGLALSVSNGKKALGKYGVEQMGVLYLALEDTKYRLRNRIRSLKQPTSDLLHFATEAPRLGEGGLDQIDAFLHERPDVGMVIIDTLAKVADPKTGANVYEEDASLGGAMHALAHHHNAAFLVVHHTRKQAHGDFLQSVSGSSGLTGTADVVMVLTGKRNTTPRTATLLVTGRDIEEASIDLTWIATNGGWNAKELPHGAYGPRFEPVRQYRDE